MYLYMFVKIFASSADFASVSICSFVNGLKNSTAFFVLSFSTPPTIFVVEIDVQVAWFLPSLTPLLFYKGSRSDEAPLSSMSKRPCRSSDWFLMNRGSTLSRCPSRQGDRSQHLFRHQPMACFVIVPSHAEGKQSRRVVLRCENGVDVNNLKT